MTNGLWLAATGAILATGIRATHRIEDLPGVTGSKATIPSLPPALSGRRMGRATQALAPAEGDYTQAETRITHRRGKCLDMDKTTSPYLATYIHIWKEIARYGNFLKVSTSRWA